ncbi:hypothetical protein, partial [Thioalkalivibrio sp.]|uniref:hypothetical protein n=1 Tax=Thioalkalivibrio sp. TaxID=2093813 RepID=UPI0025FCB843
IGGRLLVYILEASRASDISSAVASALQEGVRERDRDHFNRLRPVVVSPSPERVTSRITCRRRGAGLDWLRRRGLL